jgi:MYXO-CTERM domain-containing protein
MSRLAISLSTLVLTSTSLVAPRVAEADSCSAARVMVILDKSSSMQTGTINGATKWSIAVDGIGQVLTSYEQKAEFGLMTFPKPNMCAPGGLDVSPAMGNRTAILGALATPPPEGGSYTPMAETLEVAATEQTLTSASGAKHVVLITDGWQYCVPYDASTRFDGVGAAAALAAQGVTVWVVGFGGEVDTAALNQMAVAAGTAKTGCNAANTEPSAPNQCYFQADNAAELVTALNTIAGSISAEQCDGVDNDCNGIVDDGLTRSCEGSCGVGSETCSGGAWGACNTPAATDEVCDGADNDCDGNVDEPGPGLCDPGEVCSNGSCQPPNGGDDDGDDDGGATHAGCACDAGTGPDAAALLPFAALGAVLMRRRRRA